MISKKLSSHFWRENIISFGIFFIAALVWWFPLLKNFSDKVIGIGGDPFQTLWRFVRLGEVVNQGTLLIPEESNFRNLSPLLWLPFSKLFGEVIAYNLVWFLSAILGAWFMFLLAKKCGAKFGPALLAGLLLEFSPYRVAQSLGHFGAMQIWWLLAVFFFFVSWWKTRRIFWMILCSLFTIGLAWNDHQLFLVAMLSVFVFILFFWREIILLENKQKVLLALSLFVISIFTLYPNLSTTENVFSNGNYLNLGSEQRDRFSATLRSMLLPAPFSLFRANNAMFGNSETSIADNVHTLGFLLPILVAIVLVIKKRSKRDYYYVTVILVGFILAFGSHINLKGITIPLPGIVIFELPVFNLIRTVGRFIVLPVLLLPLLLAINYEKLRKVKILYYVAPFLLFAEIVPVFSFPTMVVETQKAIEISRYLGNGKVLAIPAYTNYQYGSEQLYYSTYYKKDVIGNSALGRIIDPSSLQVFLQTPVVRDLALLRISDFSTPTYFGQDLVDIAPLAFSSQDIGNIILDTRPEGGLISLQKDKPEKMDENSIQTLKNFLINLGCRETKAFDGLFIYDVPNFINSTSHVLAIKGQGWKLIKKDDGYLMASVDKKADFYFFSDQKTRASMSFNLLKTSGAVKLVAGDKQISPVIDGDKVNFEIDIPAAGLHKFDLQVDGEVIIIENPKVQEIK